jgi:adenylate kinase family enzyme
MLSTGHIVRKQGSKSRSGARICELSGGGWGRLTGIVEHVRRVSVVGNSGSGKTTLARQLAARLDVPHLELDSIFHLPDWQELPVDEFRQRVTEFIAQPAWVVDGNYGAVRDLVWQAADTVVWLDLGRGRLMRRLVRRTLGRLLLRRKLWNGNRERWSNVWSRDPQRSILAWAWTMHGSYRERYAQAMRDPANRHLRFVVVRSDRDSATLLAETAGPLA